MIIFSSRPSDLLQEKPDVWSQFAKSGTIFAAMLVLVFVDLGTARAEYRPPTEAQCRDMVDSMIRLMKNVPIERERDRKGAEEVTAKAEKIVRENRKRGATECDSWAAIAKLVVGH